ncbi:hypothetical protein N9L47_10825 [Rhodobacteraceae bacterium]|nr:hypothetical protein [Paracoccaceae bacterium]
MQILFHLGAHCTDDGLLIRSILKNRARLADEGIGVPGPGRYRELLGEASTALRGEPANEEIEDVLIEAIRDDDTAARIILSSENFLCRPEVVLGPDGLYPKAQKSAWLRQCLPSHDVEFAIAIRNPASFVPELLRSIGRDEDALDDVSITDLLWSEAIADMVVANPGCRIIAWCHEDTPFIWSEVISEMTGHDPFTEMDGEFDMLDKIMTPEGMSRLTEFLEARQVTNQSKRRRAVSAFLEAHAIDDAVEAEIDLPGWSQDTVQMLTELYDDDVQRLVQMPEVTFISP